MSARKMAGIADDRVPAKGPDDAFLIAGMVGGDAAALDALMARYDRLVRYTIFRTSQEKCRQDPQWVESIASQTWTGFVRSMRRQESDLPQSPRSYLVQIARNQCISAIRREATANAATSRDVDVEDVEIAAPTDEPADLLANVEDLATLKTCVAALEAGDRAIMAQLAAITERRWKDAAAALGMAESTLRSRWKHVLGRLRTCMTEKNDKGVAPSGSGSDT